MRLLHLPIILAATGLFLGAANPAAAAPSANESATLTIGFYVAVPQGGEFAATIDVTRVDGVETNSPLSIRSTNVANDTYSVWAKLKPDSADPWKQLWFQIGDFTVAGDTTTSISVPDSLKALDIESLLVSHVLVPLRSTPALYLLGKPTENVSIGNCTQTLSFYLETPPGPVYDTCVWSPESKWWQGSKGTATAKIEITRVDGVETASPISITTNGIYKGPYEVKAWLKSGEQGEIGTITIAGDETISLPLPATVNAADIDSLIIRSREGKIEQWFAPRTENIEYWTFFGNTPLKSPDGPDEVTTNGNETTPPKDGDSNQNEKRISGHILIQAKVVKNQEVRRKFLLVAHGCPKNTLLNIRLDGVDAGSFVTTKNGKLLVKNLNGDFRIAGAHKVEIVDPATESVIAQAEFVVSRKRTEAKWN